MRDNTKKYLKNIFKFTLFAAAVFFAAIQLSKNWKTVVEYEWNLNYSFLLISICLQMTTLTLFSKSWCTVLNALGFPVNLKQGFKISYLANLGRYIPGKFWQLFGMIYLLRKVNIGKKTAFASWALSWIYGLPPAFLLGSPAALLYGDLLSSLFGGALNNSLYISIFIFCVIILSILFLFIPDYSIKVLNLILGLLRRERLQFKFRKIMAIKIYVIYFIGWINYGLAFYFLIKGLDNNSGIPFMVGLGAFVLAYVIGLLALFSPGGLGVRELVLISLLSPYFGAVASGIVIAARVWSLLAEFLSAGIAVIIHVREKGTVN